MTIDVQNDFTLKGSPAEIPGTRKIISNLVKALNHFRRLHAPIVHVIRLYLPDGSNVDSCRRELIRSGISIVRPGTEGADLVREIQPDPVKSFDPAELLKGAIQEIASNEYVLYKPRWGAFYGTALEQFLKDKGIDSLLFTGCNFPNCPRTSIYEASERDFEVGVLADAVSGIYEQGIQELERIGVLIERTEDLISSLGR